MNIKELFNDDSAVSPVIGVILMVAITVILAAVIGTFVLGLGSNVESVPSAQFTFDYTENSGDYDVTVTHDGGDTISADRLTITSSDGSVDQEWSSFSGSASEVSSGNSVGTSSAGIAPGSDVRVVWTAEGGGSSQTLATGSVPS